MQAEADLGLGLGDLPQPFTTCPEGDRAREPQSD